MHIATEIPCSSASVRTPSPVCGQHSTIVAAPDRAGAGLVRVRLRELALRREVELGVAPRHLAGAADRDDLAALEQHRPVAEALHRVHVVRHEQDRAARRAQVASRTS